MIIYDSKDVDWVYWGKMTAEQMRVDDRTKSLFDETCVLYDDGAGRAYGYTTLSILAARHGVEITQDPQATLDAILAKMYAPEPETVETQAVTFARMQAAMLTNISDADVFTVALLFPDWSVGSNYTTGQVMRYKGILYRTLQDVKGAQAEHTPDVATSLYKRIGEPDPSGVWPWSQPLGATDAYKTGDKVSHNGKVWVSTVDNNVWEPGVYGWDEVSD